MVEKIIINNDDDAIHARQTGRRLARDLGFNLVDQTHIAMGISELARNILLYAKSGKVWIQVMDKQGFKGIQVKAIDKGPGISNLEMAMLNGFSTSGGLGMGLPGIKSLMDLFNVETCLGKGTTITFQKWLM